MTLRTRLAWTYGLAVIAAVAIVAIVSLAAIDRTLRSTLDARLTTTASVVATLVDVDHGRLHFDREDREQMLAALSSVMNAAVFTRGGRPFVVSTADIPARILRQAQHRIFALQPANVSLHGTTLRAVCRTVSHAARTYGYVCVWQNSAFIADVDRDALIAIVIAAAVAGGVVVILSATLARRALAPLESFTDLATEIEAHDLSRRVGRRGADELGRLGSAFDRMLDRLESAFARQRRFTADASHELRAPLAVIRAEADAALERERRPGEYQAALNAIVAEVERIDALVDALLLAARADSGRVHFEPVELDALAALAAERFAGTAQQRGIALALDARAAVIPADAASLERALAAILHNALDFARSSVMIRTHADGAEAAIEIVDDGPGFTPAGLEHATERFWRDGRDRSREGTGLGLAIAEAIVRGHGGALELGNVRPQGARVRMTFILES